MASTIAANTVSNGATLGVRDDRLVISLETDILLSVPIESLGSRFSNPIIVDNENKKQKIIDVDAVDDEDRKLPAIKKRLAINNDDESIDVDAVTFMVETFQKKEEEKEQRKKNEQVAMNQSPSGRAFLFVERMIKEYPRIVQKDVASQAQSLFQRQNQDFEHKQSPIQLFGQDDMVFLAEKFFQCQLDFDRLGRPMDVTLAYHYTQSRHLHSIRQDGLMSHPERQSTGIQANHGAYFGEGIYVGNNPHSFRTMGDTGMLVAVIRGNEMRVEKGGTSCPQVDTAVGNKGIPEYVAAEESVLRKSCQVLPVLQYSVGNLFDFDLLWRCHVEVQTLLDEFFHRTPAERIMLPITPDQGLRHRMSRPRPQHTPTDSEKFTMFTKFLMMKLELTHTKLHLRVKSIVQDCTDRNKFGEPKFANLTDAMQQYLRPVVPPAYWRCAEKYLLAQMHIPPPASAATAAVPLGGTLTNIYHQAPIQVLPPALTVTGAVPLKGRSILLSDLELGRLCCSYCRQVQTEVVTYCAPLNLVTVSSATVRVRTLRQCENCCICLNSLLQQRKVVKITRCGHQFHQQCITAGLQHDSRCPKCRVLVNGVPQGKCPSGIMHISHSTSNCGGYEIACNGSIALTYKLHSGTQLVYHENPGQPFPNTDRRAFLPNNTEGRGLLLRLKYAWNHGLLFTIGTSMTSGKAGVIVWSVHQKSSLRGGAHGWPDPNYFVNVHAELSALGVPVTRLLPK